MIPNEEKKGWHYLAVKQLSALLHRGSSKHKGNFYCSNCLHSFRTENKLKSREKLCQNKDFCGIVMPSEKDKKLGFNQYMKSDKMPYIIYANMHYLHRGKYCIKTFCESSSEHAKNIIDFVKKKMLPLTKEELKPYQLAKVCYICGKRLLKQFANDKNYRKVRDHCHYTGKYRAAGHSLCNLKFNVLNKITAVIHNGSNYDYHFIIKELVNEFVGQFECLGKKTEKYKFSLFQY